MRKLLLSLILAALAFLTTASAQTVFRIVSLGSTNPNMILSDGVTGDDGSAFAVSSASVFFTGDLQTGRFNLADLGGGASLLQGSYTRYTTLASDLQTGKIFTLATSATQPITGNGSVAATHIIEMDATTGALTANVFQLSMPISIGSGTGFFSGAGRILIDNRTRVYEINANTGAVADLASSPAVNPNLSESDSRYWGVTEFFGGSSYMVYRRAGSHDIVRTRVGDGVTTVVQSFSYLGDMSQFAVSPSTQRWYYHAEGGIFFGGNGNGETIGFADAVIELSNPNAPVVTVNYTNQTINEDQAMPITLDADVRDNFSDPNNDPLTYLATSNNPNVSVAVVGSELRVTAIAANYGGTIVVSVTATDNKDGAATNSFNLVVGAVNDTPTVSNALLDQNVYASSMLPLTLDNNLDDNFSDVEGSLASYSATSDNSNVAVATGGTRGAVLRLTGIDNNFTGTANITVTATDLNGATVSDTFVLRVLPAQTAAADLFTVTSLGTTGSKIIEANNVTGDDGSAFAVGTNGVLFTGDTATGSFNADDLSGGTSFGVRHTALSSDLRSGKIYSFGTSATAPITVNGTATATHLIEINGGSGAILGAVALSQPLTIESGTGIFAGFRRIVVTRSDSYVYAIDPTNGAVVNLGASPALSPALSESDARFWGVAEFDGTNNFLVYRQNGHNIVRTRVGGNGATTIVQAFTNLGDIEQFSVSLSRNRWYYHSERGTQFGGANLEEAVGYLDATFNFASGSNTPPTVSAPLADATVNEDQAMPIVLDNNLNDNFTDADGDALAFQAETDNPNVVAAISGGSQLVLSNLAANFTGAVNVTVSARDGRGGLITDSLGLTVLPSDNDAPVNTVPGAQTTLQNRTLSLNGTSQISISDPDAGSNSVQTTLHVTGGVLRITYIPAGLTVSGNNTNNLALTGTITNINLSLSSLQFVPAQTFSGAATLTVTTNDQGNSGPGMAQSDTDTVMINVVADADFDGVPDTADTCPNTPAGASVNQYGCAANQSSNAADGLQLWLTGDGDARDFSGNTPDAILNGGAGFALGKVGQAFNFDGVNDSINFTVPNSVTGNNPRTVEFWYNARPNQLAANHELFYYGTFNTRRAFGIDIDDTPISGTGTLRLKFFDSVDTFRFDTGIQPGQFTHFAVTYDGTTIRFYANGNLRETFTLPAPLNTSGDNGQIGAFGGYFAGQIDEVSLYNRALSESEIRAIAYTGASGKLKSRATATGANVNIQISSATVTLPSVTTAGATTETPLDGATLPTLPGGSNSGALFVDVSTSAIYTGNPTVCFNVPTFAATQQLIVYHLENGGWTNRTGARTGTQICASGMTSLSPFAVATVSAPTAAGVTVGGRVTTSDGRGIRNVLVTMTDASGRTRTASSTTFGYYRFTDVAAGETSVFTVKGKRFEFAQPTQVLNINEERSDIDFVALPENGIRLAASAEASDFNR